MLILDLEKPINCAACFLSYTVRIPESTIDNPQYMALCQVDFQKHTPMDEKGCPIIAVIK